MRRILLGLALVALVPAPAGATSEWTVDGWIGPAADLGSNVMASRRTKTTTTVNTSSAGTTTSNATSVQPASYTPSTVGEGLGLTGGLEASWRGPERLALGFGWWGGSLWTGQSTTALHLMGQPATEYQTRTVPGSVTSVQDSLSVEPNVLGLSTYTETVSAEGAPATPAAGDTRVYSSFTGFSQGASWPRFRLAQGNTSAGNPNENYDSHGGAAYSYSRNLWVNDLDLHGTYRLLEAAGSTLSLWAGVTAPVGADHRSFTAHTVGDRAQGDTATQVRTVTTDSAGTSVYSETTSWKLNERFQTDATFVAAGPMVGLQGQAILLPGLDLHGMLGYAPMLAGTATTTASSTLDSQVSVATQVVSGQPGVAPSSTTQALSQTSPSQAIGTVSGTETVARLGVGFMWQAWRLHAEGLARAYSLSPVGPLFVYGARAGAEWTF